MQKNKSADMDFATAKLYVSESFVKSCLDAVRIYGARGFPDGAGSRMRNARLGGKHALLRDFGHSAEYYRARAAAVVPTQLVLGPQAFSSQEKKTEHGG
jgi:hypothetical protein